MALTFWVVRSGKQADAGSSDAGAEHGDAVGVPAEEANVLANPTQGLDLV